MDLPMMWVVLLVVFVIIEVATMGLTTIWFAGGALIALILAIVGLPSYIQIAAFLVVSLTLLFFTRPIAMRYFNHDRVKTNAESLTGKKAIVTQTIDNLRAAGQVTVAGMEWTARSKFDDNIIPEGAIVRVVAINGVKLIVEENNIAGQVNIAEPGNAAVQDSAALQDNVAVQDTAAVPDSAALQDNAAVPDNAAVQDTVAE